MKAGIQYSYSLPTH